MFKAYDVKNHKWLYDILINPYGEIFQKKWLLYKKIDSTNVNIYMSTGCKDIDGNPIFESDILKDESGKCGIVFYSDVIAAFLFFDYNGNNAYSFGEDLYKKSRIIGNTIDNPEIVENFLNNSKSESEGSIKNA